MTAWMDRAACRDHPVDTFFPDRASQHGASVAKGVCAGCPVAEPCLEYALEHRIDHGVWGGKSVKQRREIARRRRRAA